MMPRNDWIVAQLTSPDLSVTKRIAMMEALRRNPDATQGQLAELLQRTEKEIKLTPEMVTLGVFGGVWIRMQHYPRAGEHYEGHKHNFDHVSLLVRGGLMVYVEGEEPFEVWAAENHLAAPTFFGVRAEKEHLLVPLADDTVAYCTFAYDEANEKMVEGGDLSRIVFGAAKDA